MHFTVSHHFSNLKQQNIVYDEQIYNPCSTVESFFCLITVYHK